jgi:hypothetical protein
METNKGRIAEVTPGIQFTGLTVQSCWSLYQGQEQSQLPYRAGSFGDIICRASA